MNEYNVFLSLKPAVRLDPKLDNITLNFREAKGSKKVVISKIEEIISEYEVQSGLHFRVLLQADNPKEAINEAKGLVDGIISFITLVTGVGLEIPNEELAYEITPESKERDFIQVFHNPLNISISRRTLDVQLLIQLIDRTIKLKSGDSERVARALQWYRMGTMTSNVFDKFNCFWIGLEALNPLLKEIFSVGDDPVKCPHCGHQWVSTPTVSGIRTFIKTKIPEGKKLYRCLRSLRVDLMHSKRKLKELRKKTLNLTQKISEILFKAVCFLLEVKGWNRIPHKRILEKIPLRVELEVTLVGGDPMSLGPDEQDPFFEPKHGILTLKDSTEGTTFEVTSEFTARLNPEVKWISPEVRLYGDSEMTGSITKKET